MNIPDSYRRIVDLLDERTRGGHLRWMKLRPRGREFSVTLPGFSVTLWTDPFTAAADDGAIQFGLLNREGREIGGFKVYPDDDDHPRMMALLDAARANADDLPAALRRVEDQLERLTA